MASHFPELRPADLHGRAEACRSLATTSNTADRKALWLDRAAYWEELAFEASARLVEALRRGASNKAPIDRDTRHCAGDASDTGGERGAGEFTFGDHPRHLHEHAGDIRRISALHSPVSTADVPRAYRRRYW